MWLKDRKMWQKHNFWQNTVCSDKKFYPKNKYFTRIIFMHPWQIACLSPPPPRYEHAHGFNVFFAPFPKFKKCLSLFFLWPDNFKHNFSWKSWKLNLTQVAKQSHLVMAEYMWQLVTSEARLHLKLGSKQL